ncbi:MAG: T9SS type A sorting domain-containing protein [Candidatus Marinimicrobia bacterium]|nr:T9SS type A sorting domain-containing protein [Candidatus Neomarinimicrobiota bacterium]
MMVVATDRAAAQTPPEWTVNPAEFENFMTVTSELYVDETAVSDNNTILAAFMEDECRGVASPTIIGDQSIYFLMIYGNSEEEAAEIVFRLFYAPADTVLTLSVTLAFESGAAYGSPDYPYLLETILGINDVWNPPGVVDQISLAQNYPNPFNPSTTIVYQLPREMPVTLAVYNLNGQWICDLVNARQPAGRWSVRWEGQNAVCKPVSGGTYLYRIRTPEYSATGKMILVK